MFGHIFTFTIKALTYTYVLPGLAHFTYSASIVWNRKTQRSLVRGRGTSINIYKHKGLYLHRSLSWFSFTPLSFYSQIVTAFTPHSRTDFTLSEYILYVTILKEFVFSHDKAVSLLKEYFHALEMDKTHIRGLFKYECK